MALTSVEHIHNELRLPLDTAQEVAQSLNLMAAETQVKEWVTSGEYDRITSNKSEGDAEYDRLVYSETLLAFASYIGNRGAIRLSEKGGLVRDLGMVNQQTTIRQLLSQGEVEEVQGRLRDQAKDILGDLLDSNQIPWAV
jgi:hypothetical protein